MAIATLADYQAAVKQALWWSRKAVANSSVWGSYWFGSGVPAAAGAAYASVGNTANGLVPDNTTTGAMPINAFSGTGYITGADLTYLQSADSPRVVVHDRLFHAGAYSFNSSVTLASQPSYAARIPGGVYVGTQLWVEVVTAFTGVFTVAVTYTDQSGNAGHSTGTVTVASAPQAGYCYQLPLASGDSGLQMVESVTATVASVGTFNLFVIRPLLCLQAYGTMDSRASTTKNLVQTGMQQVYTTSCLSLLANSAHSSTPLDLVLQLASA